MCCVEFLLKDGRYTFLSLLQPKLEANTFTELTRLEYAQVCVCVGGVWGGVVRARVHPEALTVHLTTFLGQSVFVAGTSVHMMSCSWSQTAVGCCHRGHAPASHSYKYQIEVRGHS